MFEKKIVIAGMAIASSIAFASITNASESGGQSEESSAENGQYYPHVSIGGSYGKTKFETEDGFEEKETAGKGFAVLKLNKYVGLEGAYIDFEDANGQNLLSAIHIEPEGITLALVLEKPLNDELSFYAKGGQFWWDANLIVQTDVGSLNSELEDDDLFWGVGIKAKLAEQLYLRMEYERFNVDISRDDLNALRSEDLDFDIDYTSIGVEFTF